MIHYTIQKLTLWGLVSLLLTACVVPAAPSSTSTAQPEVPAVAPSDASLSIVDGEGRTLTFDTPPQRLVCTYSRCMEVLAALELEPVGVTTWEEPLIQNPLYFPQPTKTEILPYDGDFPDLERLAALKPDLVFGWQEMGAALQGIAPVYNVANDQDSYSESHAEIRAFAQLLGRTEIAERNIQRAVDRLAAYKAQAPGDLSVMYGFFYQGSFSYRDGNSGTCNLLKEIADCNWPDPTDSSSWSVEVGDEGLLQFDPDVLLVDSYGFDGKSDAEIIAEVSARPLWGELTAVKTGRIYVSSDSLANMDGMGTVGMTQLLDVYAPLLYPEIFPAPLRDEEVQTISKAESVDQATVDGVYTFPNNDGSLLTFAAPPQRIICLYHECLELLAVLGVEPIATADWSIPRMFAANPLYFQQPNNIQFIPDKDDNPDFEMIAQLKPDLVIGWQELIAPLQGIAPVADSGGTSNDYQAALTKLRQYGALLGKEAEAEAIIQKYTDRLNAYKKLAPRNLTVLQSASFDGKEFWVSTANSTPCSLYNEVTICTWPDPNPTPGVWGYTTGAEGLLSLDPDVIIFESWDDKVTVAQWLEKLQADPLLRELKAVKNGRVLPDTNRDSYGIGIIGGTRFLDTFMPLLYPDVFPTPLTDEQVQEILAK